MRSYRVWEETSRHFWDQFQWGQWNRSTLEEKAQVSPASVLLTSGVLLVDFRVLRHRHPHLLFSQLAQSYPLCSRYFCLLPLCCPANCCSVNSSLTASAVPSLLLQGPLGPHPEAFTEEGGRSISSIPAAYRVTPEKEAPCVLLGSTKVALFSSFSTAASVHIIKYLLSVHSCFTQYLRT